MKFYENYYIHKDLLQVGYAKYNPLVPQPMQTPEPFRPDLETPAPDPNAPHKYIVPPAQEPHLPWATLPTRKAKPPAPKKPEMVPDKPVDNGSYTSPANTQTQVTGFLSPTKKPVNKIENNDTNIDNGYGISPQDDNKPLPPPKSYNKHIR